MEQVEEDLRRYRKAAVNQADRADKAKKQNDALEARLQDLKKINLSDQSEIKDLRMKLRVSEHERAQLSSKREGTSEMKKALQALETKRRGSA